MWFTALNLLLFSFVDTTSIWQVGSMFVAEEKKVEMIKWVLKEMSEDINFLYVLEIVE